MIAGNIVRYEVRDNTTGIYTALTKDSGGAWHIDGTNTLADRDPDQTLITTTAGQIAGIAYNNTFQDDKLDTFGLAAPSYTVLVTTSDGQFYTVYVGAKAPTSARYYAVVEQATVPVATAEATTEQGAFDVQPGEAIATEFIGGENANEEGVLPPTTPLPTTEVTEEATAEATTAPASKRVFQQATEEATQQAIATENAEGQIANESGVLPAETAAVETTTEMTAEATAAATAEATAEATVDMVQAPQVTLAGQQTIYVIPQTVIDTLKRWLTTPPYAPLPTATPTLEAVTPEATVEPTEATTAEATEAATAEADATATAEATAAP